MSLTFNATNLDSALRALVESTDDLIGLFDQDLRLIAFNQAHAEYARATDNIELFEGIKLLDEIEKNRPEAADLFRGYLSRALNGEKFKEVVPYPVEDKTFYFQLSYNPITEAGIIIGVSMFVEDISEIKNAEQQLSVYSEDLERQVQARTDELEVKNQELLARQKELEDTVKQLKATQEIMVESEKMVSLGTLASGVAHELNNPLNFIKNGLHNLMNHLGTMEQDERIQIFLESIRVGTERAAEIVNGLNHFSQRDDRAYRPCDVHDILNNCLLVLQPKLRHRITIYKDFTPESFQFKGQEGQLHQAFLHILSNAEQAIENRGSIEINTHLQSDHLLIVIKDSGQGIPSEWLNRINDPFFTTKPPGKGTGLGLSITGRILQDHGGTMQHRSDVGKGTEVQIKLPV